MRTYDKTLVFLFAASLATSACSDDDGARNEGDAGTGGAAPSTGGQSSGGKASSGGTGGSSAGGQGSAAGGASGGASAGGATTGGTGGDAPDASAGGSGDGDAGAGGDAGTPPLDAGGDATADAGDAGPTEREFVYVSARFNGGGVSMSSIDLTSGRLTPLPNAPVASRGALGVAVHNSGRFAFVPGEARRIDTFRIAADGSLSAQPTSSVDVPDVISMLALDPRGRFAYAGAVVDFNDTTKGRAIYNFVIDPDSGALIADPEPLRVGTPDDFTFPVFVSLDPEGTFAYVALSGEIGLRGYRVHPTSGRLTELADSPFPATGEGGARVFPGALGVEPSGRFLYSAGNGLNAFAIDRASGNLTRVTGSPFTTEIQSDPSAPNLTIGGAGKHLYVTKFSAFGGPPSISGFAISSATGALTPVPNSPIRDASSSPYSIAVDPSGKFALVGQDNSSVSVFALDAVTGAFVREVEGSPFPLGGLEPKIAFSTQP